MILEMTCANAEKEKNARAKYFPTTQGHVRTAGMQLNGETSLHAVSSL